MVWSLFLIENFKIDEHIIGIFSHCGMKYQIEF